MNRYLIILFLVVIVSAGLMAQEDADYLDIIRKEVQLETLFNQLYNAEDDSNKDSIFQVIDTVFQHALEMEGSFEYSWDKLDNIGVLASDDGKMKVFSWVYMKNRNDYSYACYMQIKPGRSNVELFRLTPSQEENYQSEDFPQAIENWHGKIYYQLITTKHKRKTYYTLLGADFNNIYSMIKTVEVLTLRRGKPVFRDDSFLDMGKVKNRMIFMYSAEVAMSLRYHEDLNQIVYDHLIPLHPVYEGNFQFYGPDGSFDGMLFDEGIWVIQEDVDARNTY